MVTLIDEFGLFGQRMQQHDVQASPESASTVTDDDRLLESFAARRRDRLAALLTGTLAVQTLPRQQSIRPPIPAQRTGSGPEGVLYLVYEPVVDLRSGVTVGAESLARWSPAGWGPIPPGEFLPLAEQTRSMPLFGQWVLRTACRAAVAAGSRGAVGINLSPVEVAQPDLYLTVMRILDETGLDPTRLTLEITEDVSPAGPSGAVRSGPAWSARPDHPRHRPVSRRRRCGEPDAGQPPAPTALAGRQTRSVAVPGSDAVRSAGRGRRQRRWRAVAARPPGLGHRRRTGRDTRAGPSTGLFARPGLGVRSRTARADGGVAAPPAPRLHDGRSLAHPSTRAPVALGWSWDDQARPSGGGGAQCSSMQVPVRATR